CAGAVNGNWLHWYFYIW
nr:immunoglobulin heavy chain junction region [Macaca mulatta]